MQPPEMRRLKQLEDENAKLKRIVADLSLDREMLQDVIRRNVWSAPSMQGLLDADRVQFAYRRVHVLLRRELGRQHQEDTQDLQ